MSAWLGSFDDFMTNVMPRLEQRGREIGRLAAEGHETAKAIVHYYQMLSRSFDPMTASLLETELNRIESGEVL